MIKGIWSYLANKYVKQHIQGGVFCVTHRSGVEIAAG